MISRNIWAYNMHVFDVLTYTYKNASLLGVCQAKLTWCREWINTLFARVMSSLVQFVFCDKKVLMCSEQKISKNFVGKLTVYMHVRDDLFPIFWQLIFNYIPQHYHSLRQNVLAIYEVDILTKNKRSCSICNALKIKTTYFLKNINSFIFK